MNRKSLPRAAVALATAFVLGFCALQSPSSAQVNSAAVTTQVVSSTNASGTSSVLALDGKYSSCTLTAAVSTGTASITVNGNTQAGAYGPGAPFNANNNFGTSGVVTVSSASFASTSGNFSNTPVGAFFTWSSNSGTLTAWLTCAGATGGGPVAISSIGPVTLVTPVTVNCGATPCSVTTPGPATTITPGLYVGVTDACPSTEPGAVNGAYACTMNSSGQLNVSSFQTGAPWSVTLPFPTASPNGGAATPMVQVAPCSNNAATMACAGVQPLPTASAGVAPPANALQVSDFPACESAGGLAVVTGQNFLTLQCDLAGRLYVNIGDPTATWTTVAVATATTSVVLTGAAGKQWFVYLATMQTTGSNAGTIQWERSTSNTCASGNTTLLPSAVTVDTTAGGWATLWGLQTIAASSAGNIPGPGTIPYVLPLGATLCAVTSSASVALTTVTVAGQH